MCLNDIYSQLFITCNADVAFSRFSASDVLITKQSKQLCVLYKSLLFLIMHIHLNLSHSLVMFQSFIDYTYFVFTFMFSFSLSLYSFNHSPVSLFLFSNISSLKYLFYTTSQCPTVCQTSSEEVCI